MLGEDENRRERVRRKGRGWRGCSVIRQV